MIGNLNIKALQAYNDWKPQWKAELKTFLKGISENLKKDKKSL